MTSILFFVVSILSIVLDQTTKYLARTNNAAQLNDGGIFGIYPGSHWNIVVIILLLGLTLYTTFKLKNFSLYKSLAYGIVISSGFSNAFDRVVYGGVWDWIVYPYINVVGNLADVFLGVGVCILLFEEYFLPKDAK